MSAAAIAGPRLSIGVMGSVLLHAALVAAFFFARSTTSGPPPQMIHVTMIAAPQAAPNAGLVPPSVAPAVTAPPAPTKAPPKPTPVAPATKTKPVPKAATPTSAKPAPKTAAPPAAAASSSGGRGTDAANIDTPGIDFDYPYYTNNIVNELVRRFGAMAGSLEVEVRFVIKRDGTVDPSSIKIVTPSGNYSFDQRGLTAVETAANAKVFGPLPKGFNEDILPVTFRFSPKVIR